MPPSPYFFNIINYLKKYLALGLVAFVFPESAGLAAGLPMSPSQALLHESGLCELALSQIPHPQDRVLMEELMGALRQGEIDTILTGSGQQPIGAPHETFALLIDPTSENHELNRVAGRIYRSLGSLLFALHRVHRNEIASVSSTFLHQRSPILLRPDAFLDSGQSLSTFLAHEATHVLVNRHSQSGTEGFLALFGTDAKVIQDNTPSTLPGPQNSYNQYVSFDEPIAYNHDIRYIFTLFGNAVVDFADRKASSRSIEQLQAALMVALEFADIKDIVKLENMLITIAKRALDIIPRRSRRSFLTINDGIAEIVFRENDGGPYRVRIPLAAWTSLGVTQEPRTDADTIIIFRELHDRIAGIHLIHDYFLNELLRFTGDVKRLSRQSSFTNREKQQLLNAARTLLRKYHRHFRIAQIIRGQGSTTLEVLDQNI
jgi:hypothetical protein